MNDLLFFGVGMGSGCATTWFGMILGARRERRRTRGPICGCRHHRSYHQEKNGCQANTFDGTCKCIKYVGPVPYDEFLAES